MYKKILERKKTGDNECFQKLLAGTKFFFTQFLQVQHGRNAS